jgi:hypothetical protein
MSQIEPKALFSLFHQTIYRWKIKRAHRAKTQKIPTTKLNSRLVLVTSSDPKVATKELRFARANFFGSDYRAVLCLTPTVAWNELDELPSNWTCMPYGLEQVTRFGFPTQSTLDRIKSVEGSVSVLLSRDADPFADVLFVHTNCSQRVAFHRDILGDHATLLVSPHSLDDFNPALHHLFSTIQTFIPAKNENTSIIHAE